MRPQILVQLVELEGLPLGLFYRCFSVNMNNYCNLLCFVVISQKDVAERSCTVKVEQGGHLVRVKITFPSHYPNGAAPSFTFDKSTSIDQLTVNELYKVITCISHD